MFFVLRKSHDNNYDNSRIKLPSGQTSKIIKNITMDDKYFIPIENEIDKDISIDQKYCGSNECKFLFVYSVKEQESQASSHFYSFIQLAEILNRTMVLVNVQNSRIDNCRNLPFDFYYNVKKLKELFPKVKFISQQDFLNWTKERNRKPNAIFETILQDGIPNTIRHISTSRNILNNLLERSCLDRFDFDFNMENVFNNIYLGPRKYWTKLSNKVVMIKHLASYLQGVEQVMLINHEINHALFPSEDVKSLPYASHLLEAANNVTNHLRSYIGIHWRQETAKSVMISTCSKGLVKYIKKLKSRTGLENIYLATDYPLYNAQSATFHVIQEENRDSIKLLNSTFTLNTWVSLNALDILYELFPQYKSYIEQEFNSAGVQGILDKLVLINSNYFISGPNGCTRTFSNFTKKIYLTRKLLMKSNKNIRNDISHWSIN